MKNKKKSEPLRAEANLVKCNFVGVQFDPRSAEGFKIAAESLKANAEAIRENAIACQVILKQIMGDGLKIGSMVNINNGKIEE